MQCPVCKGTGVMALPHVPGARGGWLDQTYNFSGLECGACGGSGVYAEERETGAGGEQQTPSAEEQLHTSRQLLIYTWQYSQVFPSKITSEWIDEIDGLDVFAPEASKAVLSGLRDAYEWAKSQHRPVRDIFSLSPSNEMTFMRETHEIERHLSFLEALMDHATKWLNEHPDNGPL